MPILRACIRVSSFPQVLLLSEVNCNRASARVTTEVLEQRGGNQGRDRSKCTGDWFHARDTGGRLCGPNLCGVQVLVLPPPQHLPLLPPLSLPLPPPPPPPTAHHTSHTQTTTTTTDTADPGCNCGGWTTPSRCRLPQVSNPRVMERVASLVVHVSGVILKHRCGYAFITHEGEALP